MPSKTVKQAKLFAACSHGADYPSCPPVKVAKEFNQADAKTGILRKAKAQDPAIAKAKKRYGSQV